MTRQMITKGAILEIHIDNKYYCYAQILEEGGYAFFDFRSNIKILDFTILLNVPILFILGVYSNVITQGHWLKVGKLEIRKDLKMQPMQFIRDSLNPGNFKFYNPNTGEITPATKEECKDLECAAVWDDEHVESRIKDYYNGVPNVWVEQLKIK